jgi:hypothetical protein
MSSAVHATTDMTALSHAVRQVIVTPPCHALPSAAIRSVLALLCMAMLLAVVR